MTFRIGFAIAGVENRPSDVLALASWPLIALGIFRPSFDLAVETTFPSTGGCNSLYGLPSWESDALRRAEAGRRRRSDRILTLLTDGLRADEVTHGALASTLDRVDVDGIRYSARRGLVVATSLRLMFVGLNGRIEESFTELDISAMSPDQIELRAQSDSDQRVRAWIVSDEPGLHALLRRAS
jgi:hypothetical protein